MSKEFSSLQKEILCLALAKKFITCGELLAELWGWKGQEQGTKKVGIGKAQYASAHAALSRSLTRLWRKDLIEIWKTLTAYRTGVTLTAEGEVTARKIIDKEQGKNECDDNELR